jgi:hypothetical protein
MGLGFHEVLSVWPEVIRRGWDVPDYTVFPAGEAIENTPPVKGTPKWVEAIME